MELHRDGRKNVSSGSYFIARLGLLGSVGWEVRELVRRQMDL